MYIPATYEETRTGVLHGLIAAHPLGMVVTHGASGLSADYIPFEGKWKKKPPRPTP